MSELAIPVDLILDITKKYGEGENDEEKWFVEGYAVTKDIDLANDRITEEAVKSSASDLLKNSTVLRNHNLNEEIGKVIETKTDQKGLWVKILISKTVPEIWKKVQEGVLNKFSVRMKIIEAYKKWDAKAQRLINFITKMKLVETSLVSVAMNENAKALRWYVAKSVEEFEKNGGQIEINMTDEEKDQQAQDIFNQAIDGLKDMGLTDEQIAEKFFGQSDNQDQQPDGENDSENIENEEEKKAKNKKDENESEENESKKRKRTNLSTYIRQLIKEEMKSELSKLFGKDEAKKMIDETIEDVSKNVAELKQKMIDLEKYPELLEQYKALQAAFSDLQERIDEVEKNAGFTFSNGNGSDSKNRSDWVGLFPSSMQS